MTILVSSEPNFIPILKQCKDLGIVAMNQQFMKMLNDADIPTRYLGEFGKPEDRDLAINEAVRLIRAIADTPLDVTDVVEPVGNWLITNMPAYLYQRVENVLSIYVAMTRLNPDLLLVHNDVEPLTRLMALWAKNNNKPCLHVPHAIYLDNNGRGPAGTDVHDLITASHIAVAGPYQANWYIERGMSPKNIFLTGLPQFDRLAKPPMPREQACQLFHLSPDAPVVVYKSSWRQDTNLVGCHDGVEESFLTFIQVAKQFPDLQYIVSCHPRGNNLEWHKQQLQQAGVKAVLTQDHLDVILAAANVLISYGPSNVVLECAAKQATHLIVLNDDKSFPADPEILKCPADAEALGNLLLETLSSPLPDYTRLLRKYFNVLDGNAGLRIARLASELHNGHS